MQFYVLLASLATTALAAPQYVAPLPVNRTAIYVCGDQPYYTNNYTCYGDTLLCPVINGRRQVACNDACFDPMFYACTNGELQQIAGGRFLNGTRANTTAELLNQYGGLNVTLKNATYDSAPGR